MRICRTGLAGDCRHRRVSASSVARPTCCKAQRFTDSVASLGSSRISWHVPAQKSSRRSESAEFSCHAQSTDDSRITDAPDTSRTPPVTASRQQIFASCSIVSAVFVALAAGIRLAAPVTSPLLFQSDQLAVQALLQIGDVQPSHALVLLATAGAVTAARIALLSFAPAFAEATNTSNKQVLTPLTSADVVWLSCLPGISEELLFRGALIPGTFPDWRGAVLSAAVFGVLHNSGGRNWTFAAWASAVGLLYGVAFLTTQDLFVPMGAHCLANYASAVLWLKASQGKMSGSD